MKKCIVGLMPHTFSWSVCEATLGTFGLRVIWLLGPKLAMLGLILNMAFVVLRLRTTGRLIIHPLI